MPPLSRADALELYALMVRIRQFELKMVEVFSARTKAGDFPGALHTYCGEEAIAAGVCALLRHDDYVFSTHRGHGHVLAKGADLKKVVAELNGRATGLSGGFGGSMHLYDPGISFMGTTGVVGGNLPLCLGTAYASVALGRTSVTVVFFGDGATSQGSFHESLNMAAVMRWPVIYVCENNLYAATTPVSVNCPLANIADRAQGYGIPGVVVDGNDVLAVRAAAHEAIEYARGGRGATLIECKTYRRHPHCMVIPEHRSAKERREWGAKDPIARFAAHVLATGIASREAFDEIEAREQRLLEDAVEFMQASPLPDPAQLGKCLWV